MHDIWKMYDQAMCDGGNCPLRWGCRRYLAEPTGRQDFLGNPPYNPNGTCTHFLPVRKVLRQYVSTDDIRTNAYYLSKENLSIDKLIWRFAETDYILERWLSGDFIKDNELNKDNHMIKIKELAYFKSLNQNLTTDSLHWQIAELSYIFQVIKSQIQKKNQN